MTVDNIEDLSSQYADFDFNKASLFETPIGKETLQHQLNFLLKKVDGSTASAKYIMEVHKAIENLASSFFDIDMTIKLIEFAHPKIKSFKMTRVDRGEYLQYHFENYYFRLPKIKDQALQLLNVVFRMGHKQSPTLEKHVLKNEKVIQGNFTAFILYLEDAFKSIIDLRHTIAHRANVSGSDIAMITSYQFTAYDKEIYELNVKSLVSKTIKLKFNQGRIKQCIIALLLMLEADYNQVKASLG
ncbi:Cthe_2314 family HEPN domain-containing protein [Pedobacter sp. ASV28]|uniref:Cthe_2314 family HEPN domain-containing protein n=1 Tax=Pedobacter sp. ASV28 TaxID=2795123 RepID=UPI0018EBACAB|nr:Cthe_2314 family HEPN domain-containing protein [Pedobacter sp. ASV28]